MNFLVWSPPFGGSAGVQVLHRLTHLLNLAGFRAFISTTSTNPAWNTPHKAFADDNDIVIYPEIAMDKNILSAVRYVGYALNAPGALGGDRKWYPTTPAYYYHEKFKARTDEAVGYTLSERRCFILGITSREHFYDDGNRNRTTEACWVYKGAHIRNLHQFDNEASMMMLSFDSAHGNEALGNLLRTIKTLWSYDRDSALLYMAQLCGCQVYIMGDDGKPKEWKADDYELERFVADDDKDIDRVRQFAWDIMEDFNMVKKGSGFFIAVYTNECKKYCEKEFFGRLKEITDGTGAEISIVDNSIDEAYYEHLCELVGSLKFNVPVRIEHIDVDRADRETLFQRNVTESLTVLREQFLASDKIYFVTLETDIYPKDVNLFDNFLEVIEKADIIGGVYYLGFHKPEAFDPTIKDLHPTHHVLSGCMLYKRKVIKKFPFRWSIENLGAVPDAWMSVDAGKKYKLADYYKIKCKHMVNTRGTRGQEELK